MEDRNMDETAFVYRDAYGLKWCADLQVGQSSWIISWKTGYETRKELLEAIRKDGNYKVNDK